VAALRTEPGCLLLTRCVVLEGGAVGVNKGKVGAGAFVGGGGYIEVARLASTEVRVGRGDGGGVSICVLGAA
jgi:hypothetical protein